MCAYISDNDKQKSKVLGDLLKITTVKLGNKELSGRPKIVP